MIIYTNITLCLFMTINQFMQFALRLGVRFWVLTFSIPIDAIIYVMLLDFQLSVFMSLLIILIFFSCVLYDLRSTQGCATQFSSCRCLQYFSQSPSLQLAILDLFFLCHQLRPYLSRLLYGQFYCLLLQLHVLVYLYHGLQFLCHEVYPYRVHHFLLMVFFICFFIIFVIYATLSIRLFLMFSFILICFQS